MPWPRALIISLCLGSLSLAHTPVFAADNVPTNEEIKQLMRVASEKDEENDKRQRDYTYTQREEEHHLDGNGNVKSTESRTYEVLVLYGEPVQKLIAKDDKPLSTKDAEKEESKIQKIIDERKAENNEQRQKRLAKEEKEREEGRSFVREIADAYDFRALGSEPVSGRLAWIIDAQPRPVMSLTRRTQSSSLSLSSESGWISRRSSG